MDDVPVFVTGKILAVIEPVRICINAWVRRESVASDVLGKRQPVSVPVVAPVLDPILVCSGSLTKLTQVFPNRVRPPLDKQMESKPVVG